MSPRRPLVGWIRGVLLVRTGCSAAHDFACRCVPNEVCSGFVTKEGVELFGGFLQCTGLRQPIRSAIIEFPKDVVSESHDLSFHGQWCQVLFLASRRISGV
jgi:hypothetical protein